MLCLLPIYLVYRKLESRVKYNVDQLFPPPLPAKLTRKLIYIFICFWLLVIKNLFEDCQNIVS